MAVAGIWITKLIVSAKNRIKNLKKERNELQKNIYETQKFSQELGDLIDKIDEINKKPIKVETDYEELDSLLKELTRIEEERGIELVVRSVGGAVD